MEVAKARVNATSAFLIGEGHARLHALSRKASAEEETDSSSKAVTILTTTLVDPGAKDVVSQTYLNDLRTNISVNMLQFRPPRKSGKY